MWRVSKVKGRQKSILKIIKELAFLDGQPSITYCLNVPETCTV